MRVERHRMGVKGQAQMGLAEVKGTGCTPARPQKGRVQEVWSVGGSNHKHILSAVKPVQLGQELRHHPVKEEVKVRECLVHPQPLPCLWCSLQAVSTGPPARLCFVTPPHRPPSPQCPTPNSTAPFSFCYTIAEPVGQELFGLQRLVQPVSHPSVLDPRFHSGSDPHLSITPPESPLRPRLGAKESSSSKKMMHGAAALALANT